jgi:hypothetical protein
VSECDSEDLLGADRKDREVGTLTVANPGHIRAQIARLNDVSQPVAVPLEVWGDDPDGKRTC